MNRKIVFLIIPLFVLTLSLLKFTEVSAQTNNPTISDYAKDVADGTKDIANDQDAQNNRKSVKDNENAAGKEEGEDVETKEAVEPKETENETE